MAGAPIIFPRGREVVLGVSAGIAAYKSLDLIRRLRDEDKAEAILDEVLAS